MIDFGKVPPQATDLEEAVLGAVMLEQYALNKVIDILKPEMFYKENHKLIYTAVKYLYNNSKPVDILTVTQQLTKEGVLEIVGGAYGIMQLTNKISSGANSEYYARIIQQKFIQRELIRVSSEIISDAYDETTDVLELLDKAENEIGSINTIERNVYSKEELLEEIKKDVTDAANGKVIGLSTGIDKLDEYFTFEGGMVYLLAGRPGMGKTSFALAQLAKTQLSKGLNVLFASLEMPAKQLLRWFLQAYGAAQHTVKYGKFYEHDNELYEEALEKVAEANIHISDNPLLSNILADARNLKREDKLELIVIDYIQLTTIADSKKNTTETLEFIMAELKSFAKKYNVPILVLSQLNRQVEQRPDKRPQLSDLRSSGGLEQIADVVVGLFRGEYYNPDAYYTIEGNDVPVKGVINVITLKSKDGKTGEVYVRYSEDLKHFYDYEYPDSNPFSATEGMNVNYQFESKNENVF